jgi:hypothetical protein
MTIYSGQVSTSTDDGAQGTGGVMNLTRTVDAIDDTGSTSAAYWACRFQNVTVPNGATISAASVSVYAPSSSLSMHATIYGNKTGNPGTLQTTSSYISGLASTTNTASWIATLTQNTFNASPDLSAIETELVAQPGYASGDAQLFVFHAGAAVACGVEDYDGSPSEAAELNVTYSSGGGANNQRLLLLGCG